MTLPLEPHALDVSAAAAASPSIVATETGTPPVDTDATDGEKAGTPQQVSGAYLVDGAESTAALTFDKVVQGEADTCAFDATLSAVALSNFNLASAISVLSENSPTDFLYGVRLYQPTPGGGSEPVEVSVDFNGTFAPGDVRSTDPSEFWPTLCQRAYLNLESSLGQDYHYKTNAFLALTGLSATDEAVANVSPSVISGWLGAGSPVVASTEANADPYTLDPSQGIIGNHSYTVVGIGSSGGTTYVTLRNPWGNDSTPAGGKLRAWKSSRTAFSGFRGQPSPSTSRTSCRSRSRALRSTTPGSVSAGIHQPVASGAKSVYQDQTVTLYCSAVDPDGGNVSYALTQGLPATLSQNGSFAWTPGPNDLGVNWFTVTARTSPWTAVLRNRFRSMWYRPIQPLAASLSVQRRSPPREPTSLRFGQRASTHRRAPSSASTSAST